MPRELLATLERSIGAEGLFQPGDRVAVAVSGGSDSVGLLLLLQAMAPKWGLQLTVVHFDHQLRPESGQEAEFVQQLAASRELECIVGRENVRERMRQTRRSLEETARQARYSCFWKICAEMSIGCLATGHTADDQAETVLLHLLRGSGPAGLAGISPRSMLPSPQGRGVEPAIRLVRPLLCARRVQVRQFLEAAGQVWIEDPSNELFDRSRNRIRHQLLPLLSREFNPAIVERLCATAEILRGEEEIWREAVETALHSLDRRPIEKGGVCLSLGSLRQLRLGLRRRVVRALIEEVQQNLRRVDFDHLHRLLEWIGERPLSPSQSGRGTRRIEFAGVIAEVTARELRLRPRRAVSANNSATPAV